MSLAEAEGFLDHRRYVLGDPLCHQRKELWAEVRRLYDVRDDEKRV